jgi:hypothetical protein
MPITNPPAAPTLSGDTLSISRFLKDPTWVMRALRTISQQMFISDKLLKGQMYTDSGAVAYEQNESIYADRAPVGVQPGAEYPLTPIGTGPAQMANTIKWGNDVQIFDEAISRQKFDVVMRAFAKLSNSMVSTIDSVALSAINSAVTQNTAASASWSTGSPNILRDVALAKAQLIGLKQGYNPDTVLVDLTTFANVISDPKLSLLLPREGSDTPVFTGNMARIAGMTWLTSPNLPTTGVATILDSNVFGAFADEKLPAPGYTAGEDGTQVKTMREDDTDSWRIRSRRITVPIILEPAAAWKITGVSA